MTTCIFRLDCAALVLITMNGMKLEKMAVGWHGLLPSLTKFVEQWQPPALRGETKYRDHLLETLRAAVPGDAKVEKEYRHRGTTMSGSNGQGFSQATRLPSSSRLISRKRLTMIA